MKTYSNPVYRSPRARELDEPGSVRPVIVVGAGPVGLVAAIDLARRGRPVLVLDDDDTVSVGSRAICYAKRALEILDRLGCGESIVRRGVQWKVGKVFHRDTLVYQFDLLPETGHRRPAFVNLQQYHLEECLVARARALEGIELRWRHRVTGISAGSRDVRLTVSSPEGEYDVAGQWVIAADGARSALRRMLGLETEGHVFHDRFLITDIHMASALPPERWFWFDPPFHPNQSVLLHRQADDVWRVDFQLGPDADPEEEKQPGRIVPRLRAMLGDVDFAIEWASVYTFQCRRMKRFRHGRVLFAGDAAHLVSPFGARGANSGMQDADNLAWKLDLVLGGRAPAALLDSYDVERCAAADENIAASTRSTDFITPKSAMSRIFRDAVLMLARRHAFARRLVNSGRLSVPRVHTESPLNSPDVPADTFAGAMLPGAAAADAPVRGPRGEWLLQHLGDDFVLLTFGDIVPAGDATALDRDPVRCRVVAIGGGPGMLVDATGVLTTRYDGAPGTCYLIRPDQIVCARWRAYARDRVERALRRATARAEAEALA